MSDDLLEQLKLYWRQNTTTTKWLNWAWDSENRCWFWWGNCKKESQE